MGAEMCSCCYCLAWQDAFCLRFRRAQMQTQRVCKRVSGLWVSPATPCFISPGARCSAFPANAICIREKDSCSQISPLKKYIKRMNHRVEPKMTQITGGRTEHNLGMEACVYVYFLPTTCEPRRRKGSSFFVSASPLFLASCLTASAKQCTWRLCGF